MRTYTVYLLPNNQPAIKLGEFKARSKNIALSKAIQENELNNKEDYIVALTNAEAKRWDFL